MNRGPVGDRHKLFNGSPTSLLFNLRIPLTRSVGYDTAHTLPSGLCEAMGFRVFHVEAHVEMLRST